MQAGNERRRLEGAIFMAALLALGFSAANPARAWQYGAEGKGLTETAQEQRMKEITAQFNDLCSGCNNTVANCARPCGFAEQVRAEVKSMMAAGKSDDQIIAAMVEAHGREILATPATDEDGLAAYIVPPLFLIGGAGLVYWILKRWHRSGGGPGSESVTSKPASNGRSLDPALESRVEAELQLLD